MKRLLFFLLIGFFLGPVSARSSDDTPYWSFDAGLAGWSLTNSLSGEVSDGSLHLTLTGSDPHITSPASLDLNAGSLFWIVIRMKNNTSGASGRIYFATNTEPGFSEDKSIAFSVAPSDTIFREYRIDMRQMDKWAGWITRLRIDPINENHISTGTVDLKSIQLTGDCDPQYISFGGPGDKTIYDEPFEPEVSASSGLPVKLEVVSGPAELDGDTVALTGRTGLVTLKATQEGDETYCPAPAVTRTFTVSDTVVYEPDNSFTNHWVATDGLGRELPGYDAAGGVRDGKLVGVFYYIWHGYHSSKVYDIARILKANPDAPAWGPINKFHFWGEPEYGYYRSDDPYVIRHDLQMLANANVDFIYFDVTNSFIYLETVKKVCQISMQMRKEGFQTPEITFTTHSKSGATMNQLYDLFYSKGLYEDLWFMWEGKPLILGDIDDPELRPEVRDFFSVKFSWAWTDASTVSNHWQWIDTYPQDWGWSSNPSVPDQIPVAVASHPVNTRGKSYSNGSSPEVDRYYRTGRSEEGLHFSEQWTRAHEVDPKVVMVTQWNEWIAQRFIWQNGNGTYAGRPIQNGDSYFVDALSQEFNRDMAPMKGGYSDNYYYQLVANIRKFKGMEPPPGFSDPQSMMIDGAFDAWENVDPAFKDRLGDDLHRNYPGYDPDSVYVNTKGRNDIVLSRATYDSAHVYFYAKTRRELTSPDDTRWMLLFIDADRDKQTGWEGYDYLVNHPVRSATSTTLKAWKNGEWTLVADVPFSAGLQELELKIPRDSIGLAGASPKFYFKWADNPGPLTDITAFFRNGDVAPDRRFEFFYDASLVTGARAPEAAPGKFKMFPNPASSRVTIEGGRPGAILRIVDLNGRVMHESVVNKPLTEVATTGWGKGFYLVQMKTPQDIFTRKLVLR